jgi:IstB-like ATP binding protein
VEEFQFDANPAINPAVIGQLATWDWVKADVPWLIGDSGTGKTHVLIALGTLAAEQGYRVRYTLASKLVNELVDAADDRQLSKLIARYGRVDLILIDELGYGAGPARRRTSLPGTDRKGGTFRGGDRLQRAVLPLDQDLHRPRLCAAIVDRLTFAGQIIETGTESYRLAHARRQQQRPPKPSLPRPADARLAADPHGCLAEGSER